MDIGAQSRTKSSKPYQSRIERIRLCVEDT